MKQLKPKRVKVFDWYEVINEFAEHTQMSFNAHGHWGLDYAKVCGEPDFRYHSILQFEQNYLYINHDTYISKTINLAYVLEKSEKCDYEGNIYYRIPYHLVIKYLVQHKILPEDRFLVTNLPI